MTAPTPPESNPPTPPPRRQATPHKEGLERVPSASAPTSGSGEQVLRRTIIKPAGIVPDPVDAAYVSNRLTALTHELANLLDGSMRVINLVRRSAHAPSAHHGEETPENLGRHLDTVYAAMQQMSELIRQSMTGLGPLPGAASGLRQSIGAVGSVATAVGHAVNVMMPLAEEAGISLSCEIGPDLQEVPAGPIYNVVINTVKNAIESIERARMDRAETARGTDRVVVRAWMEAGRTGRCIGIEVIDDGAGLPGARALNGRSLFHHGTTTKLGARGGMPPPGTGIGLALCKEIVEQLGGTIELQPRAGQHGAIMRVRYPAPSPTADQHVG